jgi:hypothetical protein
MYLLYLLFQENKSFGVRTIWSSSDVRSRVGNNLFSLAHRTPSSRGQRETDNGADNGGQWNGQKVVTGVHAEGIYANQVVM